jgi:hypothetical protein
MSTAAERVSTLHCGKIACASPSERYRAPAIPPGKKTLNAKDSSSVLQDGHIIRFP